MRPAAASTSITIAVVGMTLIAIWGVRQSLVVAAAITLIEILGLLWVVWAARGALTGLFAQLPDLVPGGAGRERDEDGPNPRKPRRDIEQRLFECQAARAEEGAERRRVAGGGAQGVQTRRASVPSGQDAVSECRGARARRGGVEGAGEQDGGVREDRRVKRRERRFFHGFLFLEARIHADFSHAKVAD